jgi:hypothetical protein
MFPTFACLFANSVFAENQFPSESGQPLHFFFAFNLSQQIKFPTKFPYLTYSWALKLLQGSSFNEISLFYFLALKHSQQIKFPTFTLLFSLCRTQSSIRHSRRNARTSSRTPRFPKLEIKTNYKET